jgi:phage terminase large subunit
MPHDVKQEHQGWEHTESRIMQARKHGWQLQVVPKVNFEDGIEAVRYMFPRLRIDKVNCQLLLRALREYQRLYKEQTGSYSKHPLDNWATHIADAVRYLALNYRRLYDIPQAPVKYTSG